MAQSRTIPVRLTEEKWEYYCDRAKQERMPLATLLRRRLEQGDNVAAQLEVVHQRLDDLAADLSRTPEATQQSAGGTSPPASETGILLETLLLLRAIASPDKLGMIHAELRRQGLPVWTGQK